jgi:septal ring factor EnvC (AmiA/AmiB activator)
MESFTGRCFLLLALAAVSLPPLFSLPDSGTGTEAGNELSRLLEISTRLSSLNEKLRNELADSKKNSAELSNMLLSSRGELENLRKELEDLRKTSAALMSEAENSNRESDGLRAALTKAGNSLRNLEQSFENYRIYAEARIAYLEGQGRFLKYGLAGALVLTLSGWIAFGISSAL